MATNKFVKILSDICSNKLLWCYRVYMKKDDESLPDICTNLSYYSKDCKKALESRDTSKVDIICKELLEELKKQASSDPDSEDEAICYYQFRSQYGDCNATSTLGRIYNNITSSYHNGDYVTVRNDGWALIQRMFNVAKSTGYLPLPWVSSIQKLLVRAKKLGEGKLRELSEEEQKNCRMLFNAAIIQMNIQLDILGKEPTINCWDYEGNIDLVPISRAYFEAFDYHGGPDIYAGNLEKPGNHYGVEWELDFKTEKNFRTVMRKLVRAGLVFDKDWNWHIQVMHDGSLNGGYPREVIFAADTYEGITKTLAKAKEIFDAYDVNSSTEENNSGIHITQDLNYISTKGNALYDMVKYINEGMSSLEYFNIAKRNPNHFCNRSMRCCYFVADDLGNHVFSNNTDGENRYVDRYYAMNFQNWWSNRLEWRMFNSCCNPIDCVTFVRDMNEKFISESKVFTTTEVSTDMKGGN